MGIGKVSGPTSSSFNPIPWVRQRFVHIKSPVPIGNIRGSSLSGQTWLVVVASIMTMCLMIFAASRLLSRPRELNFRQMQDEANDLYDEFSRMLEALKRWEGEKKGLQDIKDANGQAFVAKLEEFHRKYDLYRDKSKPKLEDTFKYVHRFEKVFSYLFKLNLDQVDQFIYVNEKGMISQPGDGNCLFHSLCRGLSLLTTQPNAIIPTHAQLRQTVVDWMRRLESDDPFMTQVEETVDVLILAQREELALFPSAETQAELERWECIRSRSNRSELLTAYCDYMQQLGKWSSPAEVYAFSKLYPDIRINLFVAGGSRPQVVFNEDKRTSISVFYNGRDHFDLFIEKALNTN